jgi:hypothetical protein
MFSSIGIAIMNDSSYIWLVGWFMVLNATFNINSVISWRSVLLVEESGGPGENHLHCTCRKSLTNFIT